MKAWQPLNWYWIVAGDETRVWSSSANRYYQVSNADYRRWLSEGGVPTHIASEAELAEVLRPYPPPPRLPNLEPDQFWFVVRASGYEPDLLAWVASMNDPAGSSYHPVDWAAASAKLQFAKFFERDHPFVEAAREAIGMSAAELDALWQFGAG